MPKCNCKKDKCLSPAVLQINNHDCPTVFHKVTFPAAMGDDETNPPRNGQYRNVLLVYEANEHVYMFSSDGIPTLISDGGQGVDDYNELTNKPSIEGHELAGDSSLEDIGVTDAIEDALEDYSPTSEFAEAAFTGDYDDLIGTPAIPTQTSDLTNDGSDGTSTYVEADELATVATSGSYNDLSNKPTIPAAQVNSDWSANSGVAQILNKPTLATVATSGSYNDLSNKPTIPTVNNATLTIQKNGADVQTFTANQSTNATANITVPTKTSDLTNNGADNTSTYVEADELATVATSGNYSDLSGKPTIPAAQVNSDWNANSGVAEILNKPTIPTVNNATLTITQNGASAGTFTANAASDTTISLTDTTYSDFSGATSSAAGASGLVPAPSAGDEGKVLHGDGTWQDATAKLVEMSYGESNAWAKFIAAYQGHKIVYCRASSNSNPATGTQGRKAFMAYVNNAENPTEVEFQYVRSVSSKTASQPVDQVYVYKLTSANGGTWTVQTRDMGPKLAQGTNTTVSYSNGTYTISATQPTVPTVVQTTGQSTTDVMSQKAVTDIIGNVETILQTLNNGGGAQ